MGYYDLMYFHLATVLPCVIIGPMLFLMTKGTKTHRSLGKLYMALMLVTAIITLFMPALVGPKFLGHFGWIHSFSFLTLFSVPRAYFAARSGKIRAHKFAMISLYVGAIIIAGGFTLVPGRYLRELLF